MEILLEEIVNKIYNINFAEAKQINEELERILFDETLTDVQIGSLSFGLFLS